MKTVDFSETIVVCDLKVGIVPLIGYCVATWYAVFRYLVKLTELKTSWGRGDTGTY